MALSETEKTDIVFFLGWPAKTLDEKSQIFNSIVDDRLKGLSSAAEARVRKLLSKLKGLDEKLDCAHDRLSASQIDDIKLNKDEVRVLKSERMRCTRELADLLDIKMRKSGGVNVSVVA